MTVLAFVPARGGSRSIPRKNIRPFCGRPLLWWCLRALEEARRVDRVVVSTDCDEIEAVVRGLGLAKVEIHRRSPRSATDTASTEAVMLEYLDATPLRDDDTFVLVQATSPFVRAHDLDRALELHRAGLADSLLSCVRLRRFLWDGGGHPLNYDPARRPRRQEFEGCLMENGAFYITGAGRLRASRNRLSGRIAPYEVPAWSAVELDEEDDWLVGEALMRRHGLAPAAPVGPIRMVLTDVDGVLTDGGMYYAESGDELKRFNTLDGKAFELLRARGVRTGIVTAEDTAIVAARARKLQLDHLFQGVTDKLEVVRGLCASEGIPLEQVAYLGDDLGDLELLRAVGFAACPATAVDAVRAVVHRVCHKRGGEGCLREVVDEVLLPAVAMEVGDDEARLARAGHA